jgi:hypothetical protein
LSSARRLASSPLIRLPVVTVATRGVEVIVEKVFGVRNEKYPGTSNPICFQAESYTR